MCSGIPILPSTGVFCGDRASGSDGAIGKLRDFSEALLPLMANAPVIKVTAQIAAIIFFLLIYPPREFIPIDQTQIICAIPQL